MKAKAPAKSPKSKITKLPKQNLTLKAKAPPARKVELVKPLKTDPVRTIAKPAIVKTATIGAKVVVAVVEEIPVVRPVLTPVNFKAGDKVVYPGHGPGEVDSVRVTSIGGQECQFYSITILETGMKVMVAVAQAGQVGLRKVVGRTEIDKVYEILRDRNFKIDTQTWNRRFRKYSEKIKTGSVYEIATVLRDLLVLRADKELSFSEKKIFDMAQHLLVSEIAIAKARPQEKVMVELAEFFGTAH